MIAGIKFSDWKDVQLIIAACAVHALDFRNIHAPAETGGIILSGNHEVHIKLCKFHNAVEYYSVFLDERVYGSAGIKASLVQDERYMLKECKVCSFSPEYLFALRVIIREIFSKHIIGDYEVKLFVEESSFCEAA